MSIFKCKMCGGELQINPGESVVVCDYCGTTQTLPKLDDDRRANLYDRANHFRRNNDFDKAAGIYEQILNEDKTDAEAYWSLVLCRYGIEYVEDPATHKRVPTVNRAQYTSIFDDEDYKSAIQYADTSQRTVYEAEAKAINEIQKGILEISRKEEPFDVFICYKETDANGRRTPDSVLATDLYHQLTQEGFKVFFSRITLEDKLGIAYEPYIFAALNSAKVMVVLGTKPEYFNAVWVKNEWSRYLALIKNGAKKVLIPAYRDMDPYDLPEEFSHLQAQDMSKLGFMQDLIRGIKKLTESDKPTAKETAMVQENTANTAPLLKRAFIFLEDGDWSSADEYCEKVLDLNPECAQAYLGKLLAELRVRKVDDLANCEQPFVDKDNYHKAMRFGDDALKGTLTRYTEIITDRVEKRSKDAVYAEARSKMIGDKISGYEEAVELFQSIPGWKDAEKQICTCEDKIELIKAKEEADRLEVERKVEERRIAIAKAVKKIAAIATPIACAIIAVVVVLKTVIIPNGKYNDAVALMENGKFDEACNIFGELGDYKDASDKASHIKLRNAEVGGYIKFGSYEQDNDISNGKEAIQWLVLDVKDGKALVISKYALDCQQYNTSYTDITWDSCSLRKWLNSDFINTAFSPNEQKWITATMASADKNPLYATNPGTTTEDQIFLLSITEAEKYFDSAGARQCKPTYYAVANGAYQSASDNHSGWWWLRSPGITQGSAAGVDRGGYIHEDGRRVSLTLNSVRPAMWVSLDG